MAPTMEQGFMEEVRTKCDIHKSGPTSTGCVVQLVPAEGIIVEPCHRFLVSKVGSEGCRVKMVWVGVDVLGRRVQ